MASQLDDIDNSAVWLRHLEQVRCQTEANPKQGKLAVALDAATPQHTADDAAANPLSLHTALAVPSSRQEDAKCDLDGPHRQQSSVLHRHQHCLQGSPAGSYSMHTSGSSRPPWDSSSQGTQSIKRSVSIGRPEEACGGHTDSPQAMHRFVTLLSDLGHSSYSALFALSWLFLVPSIVDKRAFLLSHSKGTCQCT